MNARQSGESPAAIRQGIVEEAARSPWIDAHSVIGSGE
jgi:hypothetical protein